MLNPRIDTLKTHEGIWKIKKTDLNLSRSCSICGLRFVQHSRFDRYCDQCRDESDLYRYAESTSY